MSEEQHDLRRSLIYLQAAKAGVDAVRAVQMAEDFDAAMRRLVTSAGTSIEEMDALKASIEALDPPEMREFEEWKRHHRARYALACFDARTDEWMVAVGGWLLRRWPWLRRLA